MALVSTNRARDFVPLGKELYWASAASTLKAIAL